MANLVNFQDIYNHILKVSKRIQYFNAGDLADRLSGIRSLSLLAIIAIYMASQLGIKPDVSSLVGGVNEENNIVKIGRYRPEMFLAYLQCTMKTFKQHVTYWNFYCSDINIDILCISGYVTFS